MTYEWNTQLCFEAGSSKAPLGSGIFISKSKGKWSCWSTMATLPPALHRWTSEQNFYLILQMVLQGYSCSFWVTEHCLHSPLPEALHPSESNSPHMGIIEYMGFSSYKKERCLIWAWTAEDMVWYGVQPSMNLKLNVLAAGAICTVWSDYQQFVLPLLGAIKRNVTPHSKWWDLTYGIKASLKLHLLQKWLCLSGDFQAEKVTPRMQKGRTHFLFP